MSARQTLCLLAALAVLSAAPLTRLGAEEHGAAPAAPAAGGGHGSEPAKDAQGAKAAEGDGKPAAGGHGEAAPPPEGETKEGAEGAAAASQHAMGKPLDGYFDLNVFRSVRKVSALRYTMGQVTMTLGTTRRWQIMVHPVFEFGDESGLAEMQENEPRMQELARDVIGQFTPEELLTVPGRMRLKTELVQAFTRRLKTAQVRQVYFIEFRLGR